MSTQKWPLSAQAGILAQLKSSTYRCYASGINIVAALTRTKIYHLCMDNRQVL